MKDTRHDIASRLRLLLDRRDYRDHARAAQLLGVDEEELRTSLDELAPWPTTAVLTAVVIHFGMDPNYLVTGQYDRDTHMLALEGGAAITQDLVSRLGAGRVRRTPPTGSEAVPDA